VAIMRSIHATLADASKKARDATLTVADLDNEIYLYKGALSELRTELKIHGQNHHAALKSESDMVGRELESLNQRFRDDIATLKSDIQIDMNNRKSEIREEAKMTEMKIQEVYNKLIVSCSDIKTDIEIMKMETTKIIAVRLFLGAVLTLFGLSAWNANTRPVINHKAHS